MKKSFLILAVVMSCLLSNAKTYAYIEANEFICSLSKNPSSPENVITSELEHLVSLYNDNNDARRQCKYTISFISRAGTTDLSESTIHIPRVLTFTGLASRVLKEGTVGTTLQGVDGVSYTLDTTSVGDCPIRIAPNSKIQMRNLTIRVANSMIARGGRAICTNEATPRPLYTTLNADGYVAHQSDDQLPYVTIEDTVRIIPYDDSMMVPDGDLTCGLSSAAAMKNAGYNLSFTTNGSVDHVDTLTGYGASSVLCGGSTSRACGTTQSVNPSVGTCYMATCVRGSGTSREELASPVVCVNASGMAGTGGMNPGGTGGMSGSGGMNPSTGGMPGTGGMNPATGGMSGGSGMGGSGGSAGGGGGPTDTRPSGSLTFEAGMGNAVTIRWRAVNGEATISGGGLDGSRVLNPMGENTGTVNDIPIRPTRYTLTVHPASGPDFTVSAVYTPPVTADPTIDFTYSLNPNAAGFLLRWTIQNSNSRTLVGAGIPMPVSIEAAESAGRAVTVEGLYTITAVGVLNTKSVSRYVSQATVGSVVGPAPECNLNRVDTATGADFTWTTTNATRVSFGKVGVTPPEDTSANHPTVLSKRTPLSGMDTYLLDVEGANGQSCKIYSILMARRLVTDETHPDPDGDGICNIKLATTPTTCRYFGDNNAIDNCPDLPNASQANDDHDFLGNDCDPNPNAIDFPNQFGSADGGCSCNLSTASSSTARESLPWVVFTLSVLILFFFRKMRQQSQVK